MSNTGASLSKAVIWLLYEREDISVGAFRDSPVQQTLFEYDKRFASLGDFVHFDYRRQPCDIDLSWHHLFDAVIADPPYLVRTMTIAELKRDAFFD